MRRESSEAGAAGNRVSIILKYPPGVPEQPFLPGRSEGFTGLISGIDLLKMSLSFLASRLLAGGGWGRGQYLVNQMPRLSWFTPFAGFISRGYQTEACRDGGIGQRDLQSPAPTQLID